MGNRSELNTMYRADCPHPAPCWCEDCRRAYRVSYNAINRFPCRGCDQATVTKRGSKCGSCSKFFSRPHWYGTERPCKVCGAFGRRRIHVSQPTNECCSPRCRRLAYTPLAATYHGQCSWCWKPITWIGKRQRRFCSSTCATREKDQLLLWHAKDRCHLPICTDCGQTGGFNPHKGHICKNCAVVRTSERLNQSMAVRRDRELSGDRGISWRALMLRDGRNCHLCGGVVANSAGKPDCRRGGTVDHLIPIAEGGTHTWDNVALAHWECNVSRGARTPDNGIQLRLIG